MLINDKIISILRILIPRSIKIMLAKLVAQVLFVIVRTFKIRSFDKVLITLYIKLNDIKKADAIIKSHKNETDYIVLFYELEYLKSFIGESIQRIGRLDYKKVDFDRLLNMSLELLKSYPENYLVHDRLSRLYASGGYQTKSKLHLFKSLKLQRIEKLDNGKTGLIFIAGLHRGGSGFTNSSLSEGLGIGDLRGTYLNYYDGFYPKCGIVHIPDIYSGNYFVPMPDGVITTHAGAIDANLKALPLITDKIVVIVRDPRQALVSKVQYSEYLRYTGNYEALLTFQYPDNYFFWDIEKKIDWQLENYYFPADLEWINGWLNADINPEFPCEIHFTQHEILSKNQKKYFQDILSFYGIPEDKFTYPRKPEFKSKTHLRKGSTDEWREVLNIEQVKKISEAIPPVWLERFNWPRS